MDNQSEIRRNIPVITGLGIVSCLGIGCKAVGNALREGKSGICFLSERKALGFRSGLSGIIQGFEIPRSLSRKMRKTLPEFGLWAWAALEEAAEKAGLGLEQFKGREDAGIVFGNDSSAATAVEQVDILRKEGISRNIGSGHIFRLLNSTISLNFATFLGLKGVSWTMSSACASGAMAIGQAAALIASGRQSCVICGGAQEISWESMCSFDALGAFSMREHEPQASSRPFDIARDGLVPSGGAAVLILESEDRARRRGACILGRVRGYGHAADGHHISVPSGDGIRRAMKQAMDQADVSPGSIDLILAHATSTQAGDLAEADAIRSLFPENGTRPPVCAPKALTGHEFWMAGASQVVYGLIMAQGGFVAGHPNLEKLDERAAFLDIYKKTTPLSLRRFLCNASGFGGTNSSLVIESA